MNRLSNKQLPPEAVIITNIQKNGLGFQLTIGFMLLCSFYPNQVQCQELKNGDLEAIPCHNEFSLPEPWKKIPFNDPACLATDQSGTTPELICMEGPDKSTGNFGHAFSGQSFISGWCFPSYDQFTGNTYFWHEGIMQEVSHFNINCEYVVSFSQAVANTLLGNANTGSWAVYLDNDLIGFSVPSTSSISVLDPRLEWEEREVYFTPASSTHTIKFLPFSTNPDPALHIGVRMGIDKISIRRVTPGPTYEDLLPNDTVINPGDNLKLYTGVGHTQWSTGSIGEEISVTTPGKYWYTIEEPCFTYHDTIIVKSEELVLHIPNAFTPNNDGLNDQLEFWIYGVKNFRASVYDRWGQMIYEQEGGAGKFSWDGKVNGREAMQGVYILQIIADGEQQVFEKVNLIR